MSKTCYEWCLTKYGEALERGDHEAASNYFALYKQWHERENPNE